ncbi:acetyl-CoA carboxylase biotin carboxyl carrier protein subunit [Mucilaginibacter limnophilus]|uniref:Acetyl-CoA carboxylase biotin carboxyl carrier protein subunit n=1 Tax=Mucilaginibacter limnophilus TaxID=1932778 RepID=A0A437MW68_9SPHI|nr:acetyl-CoA carboxylase biotin carboxyl carrier protein subunit [Mucilaginibacter limnophilus]RVU01856.1 acetyl-CoA carboxylase biotin carboxyl carrier protein subunit [Mucilaginibacter limnophilus]
MKYQVKVNSKHNYEIDRVNNELQVNGHVVNADIKQLSPLSYHIINNNRSYNVEVVNFDKAAKTAEIKVNNNTYSITAKDQFDALLNKLGLSDMNSVKVSEIKAPMPGLVLKVFVNEGSEVKKGDNLFVLEAMKMENIIKAPADVTVKSIKIKPGDKVEKGQILMQF